MTPIAPLIEAFLDETLARQRGVSRHTRDSYALSFQLLFMFAAKRLKVSPSALTLEQLDAGLISVFLEYLEDKRNNAPVTETIPSCHRRSRHALLGKDAPNLSPAVISRLTAEWQGDYDAWQKRDLSARRYVYVWADGVYLQARMEDNAECMLVLIGATPEGKKELVGFQAGVRESAQSWRELMVEVKQRGLKIAPEIAVGDGALGFWKAIDEIFPGTRHQRCWVHKTANVL